MTLLAIIEKLDLDYRNAKKEHKCIRDRIKEYEKDIDYYENLIDQHQTSLSKFCGSSFDGLARIVFTEKCLKKVTFCASCCRERLADMKIVLRLFEGREPGFVSEMMKRNNLSLKEAQVEWVRAVFALHDAYTFGENDEKIKLIYKTLMLEWFGLDESFLKEFKLFNPWLDDPRWPTKTESENS